MATAHTLPPIQGAKNGVNTGLMGSMKHTQPVHFAPAPPKGPPSGRLKPLPKKPKLAENEQMTSQQPLLTKRQTSTYRNTYKHNLCVDMLQNGFHLSFCELFALIKRQEDARREAGPESFMWNMTLLKDQHEKLDVLKLHLTKAESSLRKGDYQEVYRSRFELARYFQAANDKWLADHFFESCLSTSQQVKLDGGKMQAEGYCNMALAEEENGDYMNAAEHFESYYQLSIYKKDWTTADGISFLTDACINLSRIYTTIGKSLEQENIEFMLEYLTKAYNYAKESEQLKLMGEAAYRLGLACYSAGDRVTALEHLTTYLNNCRTMDDKEGIGKACDAIAKTYASEGRVEDSIDYLKQFVEVAERSGQEQAFSRACHNLGNIYNTLGNYEEATKYFDKAYNLSRSMGDVASININRVQFGIAQAHKMLKGFGAHIVTNTLPAFERLIEWKSSRVDDFDKPYPEPTSPTSQLPSPKTPEKQDTNTNQDTNTRQDTNTNSNTEDGQENIRDATETSFAESELGDSTMQE